MEKKKSMTIENELTQWCQEESWAGGFCDAKGCFHKSSQWQMSDGEETGQSSLET